MAKHKYQKGHKKIEGSGMKKGQKTAKVQMWEIMGEYVTNELTGEIVDYVKTLQPDKKLEAYLKLIEYFKPKLQRSEIKAEMEFRDKVSELFPPIDEIMSYARESDKP